MEYKIRDAISIDVRSCDDAPVAEAAAVEEARAGLEACAGGEVNGVSASIEKPPVDLPGRVLEDEVGDAVAIDIRDSDDPPVAEAAAVEKARAGLEAGACGKINGIAASVEKPSVDLADGVLENEIGDAVIVHIRAGGESPVAEAAAVEEFRARFQARSGGEVNRRPGAVEEPFKQLSCAILEDEIGDPVVVRISGDAGGDEAACDAEAELGLCRVPVGVGGVHGDVGKAAPVAFHREV